MHRGSHKTHCSDTATPEAAAETQSQREKTTAQAESQRGVAGAQKQHQEFEDFPFLALISCYIVGHLQGNLAACFLGSSYGVDTELEIKNGNEYN